MKRLDTFVSYGRIEKGRLVLDKPRYFKGMLQGYEDTPVRLIVERKKRGRSNAQNAYYWGVVLPEISVHTGHTVEELHEIFKMKFLATKRVWRGAEMKTVRSTTELTTNEFAEFLSNVTLEAGELGIEIPQPDQAYQFKS